jgi:hypothetical protein
MIGLKLFNLHYFGAQKIPARQGFFVQRRLTFNNVSSNTFSFELL